MHDLLADHAAAHPHRDRGRALARLLDHYTDTAGAADARLRALPGRQAPDGPFASREEALAWLDREGDALVAAALAAPALGHARAAVALPGHLARYLYHGRRFGDWEKVARSALAAAHAAGDRAAEAAAWNNLGAVLQQARRYAEAVAALARARGLHRQTGDGHGEAGARSGSGDAGDPA